MTDQSLFCPFCGAQQLKADARFCHVCGQPIPAALARTLEPVVPAPQQSRRLSAWWLLPLLLVAALALVFAAWAPARNWVAGLVAGIRPAATEPASRGSEVAQGTTPADATAGPVRIASVAPTADVARLQIVMESDLTSGSCVTQEQSAAVYQILEHRLQYLQIPGAQVVGQAQGCSIHVVVGLPLVDNPDLVANTLKSIGQLEFVEIGSASTSQYPEIAEGTYVRTTNNDAWPHPDTLEKSPLPYPDVVFKTIMTGRSLKTANAQLDSYGAPLIRFQLTREGASILADYTKAHIGDILAIVLDNVVLSAPRIHSAIPDGAGEISGRFTREEASSVVAQILSGPMPVSMQVKQLRVVSAGD